MLFSSITFLFMFLPIVMAVYYLVRTGRKISSCFLASLFFTHGEAGLCRAHDLIHRIKLFFADGISRQMQTIRKRQS